MVTRPLLWGVLVVTRLFLGCYGWLLACCYGVLGSY